MFITEELLHKINLYYDKNRKYFSTYIMKQMMYEINKIKHQKFNFYLLNYDFKSSVSEFINKDKKISLLYIIKRRRQNSLSFINEFFIKNQKTTIMLQYVIILDLIYNLYNEENDYISFHDFVKEKFDLDIDYLNKYYDCKFENV